MLQKKIQEQQKMAFQAKDVPDNQAQLDRCNWILNNPDTLLGVLPRPVLGLKGQITAKQMKDGTYLVNDTPISTGTARTVLHHLVTCIV